MFSLCPELFDGCIEPWGVHGFRKVCHIILISDASCVSVHFFGLEQRFLASSEIFNHSFHFLTSPQFPHLTEMMPLESSATSRLWFQRALSSGHLETMDRSGHSLLNILWLSWHQVPHACFFSCSLLLVSLPYLTSVLEGPSAFSCIPPLSTCIFR